MTQRRSTPLILNVDDDDGGRYAITRALTRNGYEVLEASSGQTSLDLAARERPDLILLDVRLPDIDGFEVCRRLKADPRTAAIPVLHISASYLDDQSRVKGLNTGADGYLTEPVEPAVLHATVNSLLRMKHAEQEMRFMADQWRATFDAISDGVAVIDLKGSIVRSNRSYQALMAELELSEGHLMDPELFQTMLESAKRETKEETINGRVLRITLDPVIHSERTVVGGVWIVSDISEGRRLEEQMRHAQKLESIGLLAGGVAHDFNNLLTGILGNTSLALDTAPGEITAGYLRDIMKAGERAADLARQLLAYAGKGQYQIHAINLAMLIRDILPLVQAGVPRKIDIVLEFESGLPLVEADVTQLRQLVMNLMINGAEAIGEDAGTVKVSLAQRYMTAESIRQNFFSDEQVQDGHYVLLRVEDTGCGMDAGTQARVFDPFFTTKFLGRGLGLAAALGIIRQHRGGIHLESEPGVGTTFEVALPVAGQGHAEPESQSGTVLVIDDEEIVRSVAKGALRRFGFDVVIAENGQAGVETFARDPNRFSLILLDLSMPVMSGEEVLERILEIRPDMKIIIISGYDESDAMQRLGKVAASGFLQKPFTAARLIHTIREVLMRQAHGAKRIG